MTEEQKQSTELTLQQHAEQELAPIEAQLQELAEKYRGVVYDVETTAGMDQAKKARQEIRAPRYAAQNIIRSKKSELAQISRDLGARGQAIIDQIQAIEDPIHRQIEAVEERKAAEKAERERQDRENRQRQLDRVIGIRAVPASLIGASVSEIDTATTVLLEDDLSDLDEVYMPDAQQARDKAIEALQVMRTQRAEADAQAEELRLLRAEAEAREAELAEQREREEADRQAREEADRVARVRQDAIQSAINDIRAYATMPGRTVGDIERMMNELAAVEINAGRFDAFVDDAEAQRESSMVALSERLETARQLEAERARADEMQRQKDEQAAEQRRIAQEAADAEAARQRAEAEEREQREREAQEQAIRQVTVRDAMQSAYDFLVAEGYRDATPTRMLAAALEKTA